MASSATLGAGAGLALYRVVQEALTNVAKHSGRGAEVTVGLAWERDGVEVSIIDSGGDGVGAGLPSSGHGLSGMAERVSLTGGTAARRAGGRRVRGSPVAALACRRRGGARALGDDHPGAGGR